MKILKEFKEFAVKGNLIDFAIGVVVGGAFGKVTSSFVDGIVMPFVGKIIGGVNFSDLQYKIQDNTKPVFDSSGNIVQKEVPEIFIKYGEFITQCLDFVIVAFVMFLVIKAMNNLKRSQITTEKSLTLEQTTLLEIRDLLKK